MRNHNLDRICAKRLKAKDFAGSPCDYQPMSKFEKSLVVLMALVAVLLITYQVYLTYFA